MKKYVLLIACSFFTFSLVSAQNPKERMTGKPTEQNEMKGDKHLEREMQHKQLTAKPELLEQATKGDSETATKATAKPGNKSKRTTHKRRKKG